MPSIEYPEILSITAGPESFLLGLKSTTKTCPNCSIAKTLMKDLMKKDDVKDKRIADLEDQVKTLKVDIYFFPFVLFVFSSSLLCFFCRLYFRL